MIIDPLAPLRFLQTAYEPDDCVAVLVKSSQTGRTAQRVGTVTWLASPRVQAWLRAENAARAHVFLSVNAVRPDQRSRRREAIRSIRHVFVDADHDAAHVLAAVAARPDLPPPSYVLHSSPQRAHIFWRVTGFTVPDVEALQKQLAQELGTDPAATSASQTTRLPGFLNYKRSAPWLISIDYHDRDGVFTPTDFPQCIVRMTRPARIGRSAPSGHTALHRARAYIAAMPPAVAGQHGDRQTFRAACCLVRGFALTDADALPLFMEWNARCQPPWSARELTAKLSHARQYGREPMAARLGAQP